MKYLGTKGLQFTNGSARTICVFRKVESKSGEIVKIINLGKEYTSSFIVLLA